MNEPNPYSAPASNLEQTGEHSFTLTEPKAVAAGRGWGWIAEGFDYFRRSPGPWILTVIVAAVIYIGLSLIPLVGQIAIMVTYYVWIAGFMIGCRAQDDGQPFAVNHLFAGFQNPAKLMILSVLMTVVSFVIMMVAVGPIYMEMLQGGSEPSPEMMEAVTDPTGFWLPFLVAMLLMLPLVMALWFAPALVALHDVAIGTALKLSFAGCLKNIVPMLLYGIVGFILVIIGSIPLMLGLLVVMPVLTASVYASYKDIFTEAD